MADIDLSRLPRPTFPALDAAGVIWHLWGPHVATDAQPDGREYMFRGDDPLAPPAGACCRVAGPLPENDKRGLMWTDYICVERGDFDQSDAALASLVEVKCEVTAASLLDFLADNVQATP